MTITNEEAIVKLATINSFDELRQLITQLDVKGTGKLTVLYSGNYFEDILNTNMMAKGLANSLTNI
jgi:hypothetical protein